MSNYWLVAGAPSDAWKRIRALNVSSTDAVTGLIARHYS